MLSTFELFIIDNIPFNAAMYLTILRNKGHNFKFDINCVLLYKLTWFICYASDYANIEQHKSFFSEVLDIWLVFKLLKRVDISCNNSFFIYKVNFSKLYLLYFILICKQFFNVWKK